VVQKAYVTRLRNHPITFNLQVFILVEYQLHSTDTHPRTHLRRHIALPCTFYAYLHRAENKVRTT